MKIRKGDIQRSKSFCESRLILEISQFRNDFKNRHANTVGLTKYSNLDSAVSQLRVVRKLYTLYEGLYLLEEKLGYGKKDVQDRNSILSSFIEPS